MVGGAECKTLREGWSSAMSGLHLTFLEKLYCSTWKGQQVASARYRESVLQSGLQVGPNIWSDYFRCSTAGSVLGQKQYLNSFLCKKCWNFLMINHWKVKVWAVTFRGWPCVKKNTSCFFKTVASQCTQTSYSKISCVINTVYYY